MLNINYSQLHASYFIGWHVISLALLDKIYAKDNIEVISNFKRTIIIYIEVTHGQHYLLIWANFE